jgi:hypothetical protein
MTNENTELLWRFFLIEVGKDQGLSKPVKNFLGGVEKFKKCFDHAVGRLNLNERESQAVKQERVEIGNPLDCSCGKRAEFMAFDVKPGFFQKPVRLCKTCWEDKTLSGELERDFITKSDYV